MKKKTSSWPALPSVRKMDVKAKQLDGNAVDVAAGQRGSSRGQSGPGQ